MDPVLAGALFRLFSQELNKQEFITPHSTIISIAIGSGKR